MESMISLHRKYWSYRPFYRSVLLGILFLAVSIWITSAALSYTNERAGNSVNDLLLDNLPLVNLDLLFVEGFILFNVFVVFALVREPRRIPFAVKAIALFNVIRSFFISLTHIGPYPGHLVSDASGFTQKFFFGDDFFFSGHTGLPFLMALLFWDNRPIRDVSIVASILGGASAILGRMHYSIDVFAAFFITFSIFDVAKKLFPKDYLFLVRGLESPKVQGAG